MPDLYVVLEVYKGDAEPCGQSIEPLRTLEQAQEDRADFEEAGGADCEVSYHVYRLTEVPSEVSGA